MKIVRQHLVAFGAIAGLALMVVAIRLSDGAVAGGEQATRTETVALAGATSARVDIELGSGQLWLTGGSLASAGTPLSPSELLRGEFSFDEDFEPRIRYQVDENEGFLTLEQDDGNRFAWPWDEHRNEWRLYLNPMVPTDLSVEVGAGESRLALGGLTLTGLDVVSGIGDTTLDFAGDWRTGLTVDIESGAGDLTMRLPRHVGVRVEVAHGIGEVDADGFADVDDAYVNDAYGTAPITLELRVDHGAGDLELDLV